MALANPLPLGRLDEHVSLSIDGAPARVFEVNLICLGVLIPRGAHRVRLHFRPAGLVPGLALAALVAVSLAALRSRRVA